MPKNEINFIECEDVGEANKIDMDKFSFIGLKKDKYCFKRRVKK